MFRSWFLREGIIKKRTGTRIITIYEHCWIKNTKHSRVKKKRITSVNTHVHTHNGDQWNKYCWQSSFELHGMEFIRCSFIYFVAHCYVFFLHRRTNSSRFANERDENSVKLNVSEPNYLAKYCIFFTLSHSPNRPIRANENAMHRLGFLFFMCFTSFLSCLVWLIFLMELHFVCDAHRISFIKVSPLFTF